MEEDKKENESEHSAKKSNLTEKVRGNPWMLSTLVLGALVVILLFTTFSGGLTGNVTKEKAADNLVTYLSTIVDSPVELISVENSGGLYLATINYQNQDIPVYLTKDGKYYTLSLASLTAEASSNTNTQTEEIPKTTKPSVELYVMSFCPYGNEAEKTMQPVYDLLKDKVDWNIHFIVSVSGNTVSSLHGANEVTQNEREACVIKNYGVGTWFKFANYVNNNCGSDGSCWQDAAKAANVDVNTINSCVTSSGLDLMKAEAAASDAAGANGSPTLIINGVNSDSVYKYGNSELYKGTICSTFNDVPSECSQVLSSTSTAASGSC